MVQRKPTDLVLILIIIASLGVIASGLDLTSQQPLFSTIQSGQYYLVPNFGNVQCELWNTDFQPADYGWDIPDVKQKYRCGGDDWYNHHTKQCVVQLRKNSGQTLGIFSRLDFKECTANGDCQDPKINFPDKLGIWETTEIVLQAGEYIETEGGILYVEDSLSLRFATELTRLEYDFSNNLRDADNRGCAAKYLPTGELLKSDEAKYNEIVSNGRLQVGQFINWVGSYSPVDRPLNIINFKGNEIYVVAPEQYYEVTDETLNGAKLIRTDIIKRDPAIECVPESVSCSCSSNGCVATGTFEPQGTCIGAAPSWIPKNSDEVCEYSCIGGQYVESNCKDIPECVDGEILDTDYNCIAPEYQEAAESDLGGPTLGIFDSIFAGLTQQLQDLLDNTFGIDIDFDTAKWIIIGIAVFAIFFVIFSKRTGPSGYVGSYPIIPTRYAGPVYRGARRMPFGGIYG